MQSFNQAALQVQTWQQPAKLWTPVSEKYEEADCRQLRVYPCLIPFLPNYFVVYRDDLI